MSRLQTHMGRIVFRFPYRRRDEPLFDNINIRNPSFSLQA